MRLRTRYTQRYPTAPGLRLDIPMFEGSGTKALDLSGKGNHGTIHHAVWTRDENGVCMSFNGTSAYIDCGNDASLNITDAITIEAGVKISSGGLSGYNTLAARDYEYNRHFLMYLLDGYMYATLGAIECGKGGALLTENVRCHLAWAYNSVGTTMKYHINGNVDKTFTSAPALGTSNRDLWIGAREWGGGQLFFNGTIDLRVYALELTANAARRRKEQKGYDYVRAS